MFCTVLKAKSCWPNTRFKQRCSTASYCQQELLEEIICSLHDVTEISNGQLWQNSSQSSVLWRGAKCHGQVSEFLLSKNKKIVSKFKASNTLFIKAEYAITRQECFRFFF